MLPKIFGKRLDVMEIIGKPMGIHADNLMPIIQDNSRIPKTRPLRMVRGGYFDSSLLVNMNS